MTEEDIHSCSYECQIPACIKAQRDKLRDEYFALLGKANQHYADGWNDCLTQLGKVKKHYADGWNAALDEAAARIGEIKGFGQATQDSFAAFIKGLKK